MKHSPSRRAAAALLAGLLAFAPALRALAAGKTRPVAIVLPYAPLGGVSESTAAKATELLTQELRARYDDLKIADAPAARAESSAQEKAKADAAASARARVALGHAAELARKGKHAQAAEALRKGIAQLTAKPLAVDEEGGRLLADASLQLAVERLVAGDEDGGDGALAMLVRLAPERTIAAADYPPAFVRELDGVRKRLLAAPRGRLRVLALPGLEQSRLLLDGRALGAAPALIKDVLPGEHFVRVERAGAAFATRVVVVAGAETEIAPPADASAAPLAQGLLDKAAAASAAKAARAASAQAAVLGAVVRTGDGLSVRTFLCFARSEKIVALAPVAIDAEMLGASVEMLRLADEVVAKLSGTAQDAPLPIALGDGAAPRLAELSGAPPAPAGEAETAALPLAPLVGTPAAPAGASTSPTAAAGPTASTSTSATSSPTASLSATSSATSSPSAAASSTASPAATATADRRVAVAGAPVAPPPAAAPAAPPPRVVSEAVSSRLVVPREPTREEAADVPAPASAKVVAAAPRVRLQALQPDAIKTVHEAAPEKKNHALLWVIAGVVVAGAATAGGIYLYENGRSPSTATVNATWSK